VLSKKVVGQPAAMKAIVSYVDMYRANLSPEGRPAGIFLLLGPTGTGKTRTVQALAEILHGSPKNILKVNCGEYQLEHEVAKLIGAPPGYVGHRESVPLLTQARLTEVTSPGCDLSLVLFDEIEKAAPSLTQLLLGVLDTAQLQLGDGQKVDFQHSMIFLTSNLGAHEMMKALQPAMGFHSDAAPGRPQVATRMEANALAAVRKMFSPEFVNRIDAVMTYQPLDEGSLAAILDQHITELQNHVTTRLGPQCFEIEVTDEARKFLLRDDTSAEYGARELKRTIHRNLTQPLATLVTRGEMAPASTVRVTAGAEGLGLTLLPQKQTAGRPTIAAPPCNVLIVDDNLDLLGFLGQYIERTGWKIHKAESVAQAKMAVVVEIPNAALLDLHLPDGNGLELAFYLRRTDPQIHVILMTGGGLTQDEEEFCREYAFPILRKPFLASQVVDVIQARLARRAVGAR
jgi:ATP-dependent Clp protease ATP-binding subunit ClpA/ActR/RegA family two-component response regulator